MTYILNKDIMILDGLCTDGFTKGSRVNIISSYGDIEKILVEFSCGNRYFIDISFLDNIEVSE